MRAPLLLLLSLPLLAPPAQAASFDPKHRWSTLRTDHFDITFHEGEEQLAAEMAEAAEDAFTVLIADIDGDIGGDGALQPGPLRTDRERKRTQVVLVDPTDSANGYATIIPNNQIVIFVTAPQDDSSLGLYEDWGSAIMTHELTHVLHLDTVGGLPAIGRLLFGNIISPNLIAPGWVTEGYATFQETRHTSGGRGRSLAIDMIKRAAWLEGAWPDLGNLDGYQSLPPGGNLRYAFGQDFIQFIADRTGSQKWSEWVHRYGASIPYILGARKVFGEDLYALHRAWKDAVAARYSAQIRAIKDGGLTPFTVLSDPDIGCGAPAIAPDGRSMVWSCSDPQDGSAIWISDIEGKNRRILLNKHSARSISWRADGQAIVFSELRLLDSYSTFEDVMLYDLPSGKLKSLTTGARAHDPVFSPDGKTLMMVTNRLQENSLATLTVDQKLTPLTRRADHTQFGTPRYSPDGQTLAVSVWQDGMRDLWLYTPDGQPISRLTHDAAIDRDPAFSPDGQHLYFSSDRSGVPDIYAVHLATRRLYRVTNVTTGAYNPSPHPDGRRLAFEVFTTPGGRVAMMDTDPAEWKDLGQLPWSPPLTPEEAAAGIAEAPAPYDPLHPPTPPGPFDKPPPRPEQINGWPVSPYNPWPLAFPPRYWLPSALLTTTGDTLALYFIASTGGSDPLRHIGYNAYATWRTDAQFLGGGGSFTLNRWRPVLSASASTYVTPFSFVQIDPPDPTGPGLPGLESARTRYWDHRVRAGLSMSYPLTTKSALSAWYQASSRQPLDPLPEGAYTPQLPTRGFFSSLGVGWAYSSATASALSVSPEKGRVLTAGAEYKPSLLGSYTEDDDGNAVPFDQLQLTAQWREYRPAPWLHNHVFALRLAGGASLGDRFRYGSYRLGGSWSEGGVYVLPDEWRALRGFYPDSASGEWFWLGSGEYRFPLLRLDRGMGALPVFFRWLSGSLLVEAGNAFDDPTADAGAPLVGVGGELNANLIVGWAAGLNLRLGYAFAVSGSGIAPGSIDGLYLALGGSY